MLHIVAYNIRTQNKDKRNHNGIFPIGAPTIKIAPTELNIECNVKLPSTKYFVHRTIVPKVENTINGTTNRLNDVANSSLKERGRKNEPFLKKNHGMKKYNIFRSISLT
jgi:hypothetical protein